ncbi:MerR family transcriptional regulator [Streptomyces sp. NPDC052036]|uniref:MerR family transcriptional regulator n=1 Tax=Streptomyces sp. NPDC052036 TaxID=3155171 RepID=UPI003444BE27
MTTETEEPTLTVDELAARAGVTVRTVRFYSAKGLLPPPVIGPRRVGRYGQAHLARLALIEELQRRGMTLAAIERHLRQLPADVSARDLAIHRAVVASWAPDTVETMTREELQRRAGRPLGEEDLERLAAMSVAVPYEDGGAGAGAGADGDGDAYRVDPGLLRLGVELLDVPLGLDTVLAARGVLIEHSRAAARELSRLLREAVAERDSTEVKSLSAHMQPLVVQALLTTFQRSLREELREWLTDGEPARES